jgi:adenylosuccinate lyase
VIERYTRPQMGAVWTTGRRMERWLEVELAAIEAWAAEGGVPPEAARACRERAAFTVEAVQERERETGHDVAAFVDVVAEEVGPQGRWIHYGLTSSDVLDTGLALQLGEAGEIIRAGARGYRDALVERALEHRETVSAGRTHGIHAEPTTFGLRLAGFAFEAERNLRRLERAFDAVRVGKLSGAVGTYASVPPTVERRVMEALGLHAEDVSTQVVPRDRHAELCGAIALAGTGLERFATEVRNLQRTEVREVEEPFGRRQKGSSAMPHKRNPILAERLCGLARVLRGCAQTAYENVALWHERDISHSGAERIVLPDATILLDYMLHAAERLVREMRVDAKRMLDNLELTHGALYSQRALTALVEAGMQRDAAYRIVQESARRAWDEGRSFRELLTRQLASGPVPPGREAGAAERPAAPGREAGAAERPAAPGREAEEAAGIDWDAVFDPSAYLTHVPELFDRLEALRNEGT